MDKETLLALGKHLKQFITLTAGPRIGMILPPTFKSEGCDHTLVRTTAWLEQSGLDAGASIKWLRDRGADCDCKVLTNIILRLDDEC